jgi:hypothetical protein
MGTPVFNVFEPTTVVGDTAIIAMNAQASWELCDWIDNQINPPPFLISLAKRLRYHWARMDNQAA